MIAPASATYQHPVPMPDRAPPRIRYLEEISTCIKTAETRGLTHPLVAVFGVAVVAGALDGERRGTDNKCPLDANLVHQWTTEKADRCKHSISKCGATRPRLVPAAKHTNHNTSPYAMLDVCGVAKPPPPRPVLR